MSKESSLCEVMKENHCHSLILKYVKDCFFEFKPIINWSQKTQLQRCVRAPPLKAKIWNNQRKI